MLKRVFVVGLVGVALFAPAVVPESALASDWPQYRGPTRDGIAPAGPKLLDAWPTNGAGPKLLWQSEVLWPDKNGKAGCASVSIADGKAFTFAYIRRKSDKVVLSSKDMENWGWMDGVPDDLVKKVQEERKSGKSANMKPGAELDAYATQYVAGLDAEAAKKFGPWVQRQLTDPNTRTVPWEALVRLAPMRDKESSIPELDGKAAIGASGWGNAVRSFLTDKVFKLFDTIICLDAATGKELWRKEFPGGAVHLVLDIGPSSTPTIADGKCYVQGSAGFYCLDAKDGTVVWQAKTKFSHSSPLVMNGVVYCLTPEATAFDAKTGKVLWTQPTLKHTDCSFTKWTSAGKDYLITAFPGSCYDKPAGGVYCLDPATGSNLWAAVCSATEIPVFCGADIVGCYYNGNFRAFKISPTNAVMLWEARDIGGARGSSPVVFQDHFYPAGACHSGDALCCLDVKTGAMKWNPHSFCAESSSPVLADGKIITLIEEDEGSLFPVMYRAAPEKFEELGRFNPHAGPGASPAIANGKLYLRLQETIACYDIAEHRPYWDGVSVAKDELMLAIKQADGGLRATGAITGLTVSDATGRTTPAKAQVKGASLVVDITDAALPVKVSYVASGNLSAKNGPLAPFTWQSPRLSFDHCETNTLVMKFDHYADCDAWKSVKNYAVAGARIAGIEVDASRECLRLVTDKSWKPDEKTTVRYPAFFPSQGVSARTAEASFTVTPGQPVAEVALDEYLVGEVRDKVDPATIFDHDDLDKHVKPVAGEKWRRIAEVGNVNGRFQDSGKLQDWLKGRETPLVHACVYVHAEANCKCRLNVFAYGGVQVCVNGKPVYTEPQRWQKKEIKDVEFKQGWNTLLLELTKINGWCGPSVVIRNEQGDGVPAGLRYTTERPNEERSGARLGRQD